MLISGGLLATAPAVPAEMRIVGFSVTPDRQVSLSVEGGPPSARHRLEYLTRDQPPVWLEDARAIVVPNGEQAAIHTRLPQGADSRFLRVVATDQEEAGPLRFSEIVSDNVTGPQAPDDSTPDWVELENTSEEPVELGGYGLGDDPDALFGTVLPPGTLAPGARVLILMEDFGIDASGETIYLTSPEGWLVESVRVPPLGEDESIARRGDGWFVMAEGQPTPGGPNADGGVPYTQPPRFSLRGGSYDQPVTVRLGAAGPGHTIRYTVDGSLPDGSSPAYDSGIEIGEARAVRARSFDGAGVGSPTATQTYLVGSRHSLPVVAITAPPENFDFHLGYLYGMGSVLTASGEFRTNNNYPYSASNAWKDREAESNVELFEPDGSRGFNVVAGLKVFGGWGSRGYPQKSFAVFARRSYGYGKIRYQLFPDTGVQEFESFVLRNSGNDNQSTHLTFPRSEFRAFGPSRTWGSYFVNGNFTHFRDAALTSLGREIGLDTQAYRPAVLYVNGRYWGIYNIREKLSEHYVESHFGVPDDQVDLIEGYGSANAGSATTYSRMRALIDRMDSLALYRTIEEEYLDIANFIDYHLSVIYFQNFDIGNIKCWRSRRAGDDGRFRWLLYDQDYGFGLWPAEVYGPAMARDFADYDNMFAFYTNTRGTGWPNGSDRTLLLRRLLGIDEFKTRFILRCADLLNSTFREDHVTARVREMAAVIRPEIPAHLGRWSWASIEALGFGEPHKPEDAPLDLAHWERNVETMVAFAQARPGDLRGHLIDHFDLPGDLAELHVLEPSPPGAGHVQVNTLVVPAGPTGWTGIQFTDFPPPLTAHPRPGFRFVGWDGGVAEPGQAATAPALVQGGTVTVGARFEPEVLSDPRDADITISEFMYHPRVDSGDWVELRNSGSDPVSLDGWVFRDEADDHVFPLPSTELPGGAYLVIAEDLERFSSAYPEAPASAGGWGFGLGNGGDTIRLFNGDGALVRSVTYDDAPPWPLQADGDGFSLVLRDDGSAGDSAADWEASAVDGGTPGF